MTERQKRICAGAAVLGCGIILESRRETGLVRKTVYDIRKSNMPAHLQGKTFVFLSDFHEASCRNQVLQAVEEVRPAFILAGGDMINAACPEEDIRPAASLLNRLSAGYPVYLAMGNHERRARENFRNTRPVWDRFRNSLDPEIRILGNNRIFLKEGCVLQGLDLPLSLYRRGELPRFTKEMMTDLIGEKQPGAFTILLAHNPDFLETYGAWGADLVLSGHIHGGLIRIPGLGGVIHPRMKLFPAYDYGLYETAGSTDMIVTNGLGQHTVKLRLNNVPEIVVVRCGRK